MDTGSLLSAFGWAYTILLFGAKQQERAPYKPKRLFQIDKATDVGVSDARIIKG